ncbi:MAG: hypothetical protein ACU0A5_14720 [Salipiger marinus]|uniref:hypothetical protein n=1 Tax=Salipiger marinus TaxID=555512 RepID=UPI00405915D1
MLQEILGTLSETYDQLLQFSIAWKGLQLQEQAATWTAISAIFTGLSALGVICALVISGLSLRVTAKTGRDQTRAYVDATRCEICYGGTLLEPTSTGDFEGYYVRLTIQNFGQTPASEFQVMGKVLVRQFLEDSHGDTHVIEDAGEKTWRRLFPTTPRSLSLVGMGAATPIHAAAKKDEGQIYRCFLLAQGSIRYTTIHGEKKESPFSFTVDGDRIAAHFRARAVRRFGDQSEPLKPLEMQFAPKEE